MTNDNDTSHRDPILEAKEPIDRVDEAGAQLRKLSDEELGKLFRECLYGLCDTFLEGFTHEDQVGISRFLEDMNIAHRALSKDREV